MKFTKTILFIIMFMFLIVSNALAIVPPFG